jgi:hypothetical protein
MGVKPAADMAAAVKKLGLRSVMEANEHSAVGAPASNRYGLDEDTYAWMRQGINALRKQAASKMKKQVGKGRWDRQTDTALYFRVSSLIEIMTIINLILKQAT